MLLATNFCEDTVNAWKIAGTVILVVKIVVPLIITIVAIVPLVEAVMKGTAESVFAAAKNLMMKMIAALIVFMVPVIIPTVFNLLVDMDTNPDMQICSDCIKNPNEGLCAAKSAYDPTEIDEENPSIGGSLETGNLTNAQEKKKKERKNNSSSGSGNTSGSYDNGGESPSSSSSNVSSGTKNIIVGDSRTVGMCATMTGDWNSCSYQKSGGKSNGNDFYIAQGSMSYSWFNSTAVPKVNNIISSNPNTKYNIYSLMGVNMLLYDINKYIPKYNELANGSWKNQKIILVSVTPVNESIEAKNGYSTKNSDIKSFNKQLKAGISASNISYCDAYNALGSNFGTPDGLHYDSATYKSIYNIIMGCK